MTEQEKFLESCYHQHALMLLQICSHKVNQNPIYDDLIDTCIQDTFLLAYEHYDELSQYENIKGWLIKTCLNRLLPYAKLLRSRYKKEAFSLDQFSYPCIPETTSTTIENFLSQLDAQEQMNELYTHLSPREQQVYLYHFLWGYTAEVTAKRLHSSVGSAKSSITQIRKKAKKLLLHPAFFER